MITGSHIIGLTMLSATEEGIGLAGISYEGIIDGEGKGYVSIWLSISISVNGFHRSGSDGLFRQQSIFNFTPAVKFYPGGSKGRNRYAIAIQYCYEDGKFYKDVTYNSSGPYGRGTDRFKLLKSGLMLNNSINFFPKTGFYCGMDLGVGATFLNQKQDGTKTMRTLPRGLLVAFNLRMGWRV